MTCRRTIIFAGCRDACVPHVRAVVRVVSLVQEPLRSHSAWNVTTPRVLQEPRHPKPAADPSILRTSIVPPLTLGR